jgi:hypothetical protein
VLFEKKILNETKNYNPPFKLNGRSLRCSALQKVRSPFLTAIQDAIYSNVNRDISDDILKNEENLCQIIIDCTKCVFLPKKLQIHLEAISRVLCHRLFHYRSTQLKKE